MSAHDPDRMKFLALKLRAGVPLTEAEQREWDQGATWRERLPLLASRIRAGLPISEADQSYWDQNATWSDKIAAGLPLTEAEQEKSARAKDARVSIRGGAVWVDAPSMTIEDWKAHVAKSRAAPAKLVADAGTDKPPT